MKLLVAFLLLQIGLRPPLAPAETLLEPAVVRAIVGQAPLPESNAAIAGTDSSSQVLVTCVEGHCGTAAHALRKLSALVGSKTIEQPMRSIRLAWSMGPNPANTKAVIHVAESNDRALQIIRGLWSTAGIGDEVAEIFGRHIVPAIELRPYEKAGQLAFDAYGVPTTTIMANPTMSNDAAASIVALTAYVLATLPNPGSEALLSHLTVGAHARLAEDGRRAVAMMGNQQRANAEVLIMFGQAIEREQRRMQSFERYMPAPIDPMLDSRIADMQKGITSVWTSMGITSSPFVPAAERIRGRGGEDRRVPSRVKLGAMPTIELPTAFLKFANVDDVIYELGNFVDGSRSISDIRDAVSAEFAPIALPVVVEYFERLATAGAVTFK